jgi:hypothetical protein
MQHLQSVLVVVIDDIKSNIKVWLDDCLLHTKTEDDLLATLNFFFKLCQKNGLKLYASKCVLLATMVKTWCSMSWQPTECEARYPNTRQVEPHSSLQ